MKRARVVVGDGTKRRRTAPRAPQEGTQLSRLNLHNSGIEGHLELETAQVLSTVYPYLYIEHVIQVHLRYHWGDAYGYSRCPTSPYGRPW